MANNLVICAIPEVDDRVWKISSEKIPHLTLLFLGETEKVSNLEEIYRFVQHAVKISEQGPVMLDVDRRAILGDDKADVIHFRKDWSLKRLERLRSQLLQNSAIKTAYDSADQFPEWHPHLTLGYPETPAKESDDDHKLSWVTFDRIAVWTGNYEGPEFRLEWPERELEEVRWSGMSEDLVAVGAEVIEHFGTKGMKWGVRKQNVKSGVKSVARFAGDVHFESRVDSGKATALVARTARKPYVKEDLARINAKPEYQKTKNVTHRLKNPKDPLTKQYRKEAKEAYIQRLEKTANSMKNPSGNREYTIRERHIDLPAQGGALPKSRYFWEATARNVKHAAGDDDFDIRLEVILDDDGFIVDLEEASVEDSLAQTADTGVEFLEHVGIKGMRWGHRRSRPAPVAVSPKAMSHVPHGTKAKTKIKAEGGENHPAHEDAIKVAEAKAKLQKSGTAALSNHELREVATRLQLEAQVKQMTQSGGKKFVSNILKTQGQNEINTAFNTNRQMRTQSKMRKAQPA